MENEDLSSGPNLEEGSKIEPMNSRASLEWARIEDWAISISLGLMMVLPLLEIVLRRFNSGISGSAELLQHLVLFVAMLGGAIAARENRLLSLSTFTAFLTGSWAAIARSFSASSASRASHCSFHSSCATSAPSAAFFLSHFFLAFTTAAPRRPTCTAVS